MIEGSGMTSPGLFLWAVMSGPDVGEMGRAMLFLMGDMRECRGDRC